MNCKKEEPEPEVIVWFSMSETVAYVNDTITFRNSSQNEKSYVKFFTYSWQSSKSPI